MLNTFDSVLANMTPDEMPNQDLRDIASEFGVPTALKMVKEFGGSIFYIPKIDSFKAQAISFIKKNYNGHNAREVANSCRVSIRYVYKIIESASVDNSNNLEQQVLKL
jgi:Mor family transcriptional regulator